MTHKFERKNLLCIFSLISIFSLILSGKTFFMDYKPNVQSRFAARNSNLDCDEFMKKDVQKNPSIFKVLRCGAK